MDFYHHWVGLVDFTLDYIISQEKFGQRSRGTGSDRLLCFMVLPSLTIRWIFTTTGLVWWIFYQHWVGLLDFYHHWVGLLDFNFILPSLYILMGINHVLNDWHWCTFREEEPSTVHQCAPQRGQISHHSILANGCNGIDVLFGGASSRENSLLEFHLMAGTPSCP